MYVATMGKRTKNRQHTHVPIEFSACSLTAMAPLTRSDALSKSLMEDSVLSYGQRIQRDQQENPILFPTPNHSRAELELGLLAV